MGITVALMGPSPQKHDEKTRARTRGFDLRKSSLPKHRRPPPPRNGVRRAVILQGMKNGSRSLPHQGGIKIYEGEATRNKIPECHEVVGKGEKVWIWTSKSLEYDSEEEGFFSIDKEVGCLSSAKSPSRGGMVVRSTSGPIATMFSGLHQSKSRNTFNTSSSTL